LLGSAQHAADHPVLDEHLHPLREAGGQLASALHSLQIRSRDQTVSQGVRYEVGRRHGILEWRD
jgi:hypothetical protein